MGQNKKMKTITISKENHIDLTAFQGTDGNRFAELFRRVWEGIPSDHRHCMRSRWKLDGQPYICIQSFPIRNFEGGEPFPIACDWSQTEEFRFRSTWIDQMPDGVVEILVAHELAHCLIIARRSDGPIEIIAGQDEEEAEEVMGEWGFCDAFLDTWVDENAHSFLCEKCNNEVIGPIGSWEQCPDCLADYLIDHGADGVKPIRCSSAKISELLG